MADDSDFSGDAFQREMWTVDVSEMDGAPYTNVGFLGGPSDPCFAILGNVAQAFAEHIVDGGHDSLTFDGTAVSEHDATAALNAAFDQAVEQFNR